MKSGWGGGTQFSADTFPHLWVPHPPPYIPTSFSSLFPPRSFIKSYNFNLGLYAYNFPLPLPTSGLKYSSMVMIPFLSSQVLVPVFQHLVKIYSWLLLLQLKISISKTRSTFLFHSTFFLDLLVSDSGTLRGLKLHGHFGASLFLNPKSSAMSCQFFLHSLFGISSTYPWYPQIS